MGPMCPLTSKQFAFGVPSDQNCKMPREFEAWFSMEPQKRLILKRALRFRDTQKAALRPSLDGITKLHGWRAKVSHGSNQLTPICRSPGSQTPQDSLAVRSRQPRNIGGHLIDMQ